MRLIDADILLNNLKELGWLEDTIIGDIVDDQSTAYNVDKVVEELKSVGICANPRECYGDCEKCQYADLVYKDTAIDIVKAGGVKESE